MATRPTLSTNRPSFTASPPPMTPISPVDSRESDSATPRPYFRRQSLAVAGARRSSFYNSYAPTSPIAAAARPTARRGSGSFGSSFPSSGSIPTRPERHGTAGATGVSFRNAFAMPFDEETIIEDSSADVSPGSTSPRPGPHPYQRGSGPRQAMTMPIMPPRRRRSSAIGQIHWLPGGAGGETGDEPGVDVRSARDQEAYGHLTSPAAITVIDYSSDPDAEDTNVRVDFPGTKLNSWLNSPAGQRPLGDDNKPLGVRWIHVTGLNWEVVKALTLRYQLHPLAVEDALRSGRSPRSKVDYYRTHMYLQILVHHIHGPDKEALTRATKGLEEGEEGRQCCDDHDHDHDHNQDDIETVTPKKQRWWQRNAEEGQIRLPEGVDAVFGPSVPAQQRRTNKKANEAFELGPPPEFDDSTTHRLVVDQLSASYMVPIRKGIISAFMMRDGLIITMCENDMSEALEPIYERVEDDHSLLRRSGDVSMLAQALLDVSVDLSIELAQAFEAEILKAESQVLVSPQLEFVRRLFIVQAQITRFRRQLTPLLYACYIIRDQDTARSAAAGALTQPRRGRQASTATTASISHLAGFGGGSGAAPTGPSQGISPHLAAGPQGIPNIHGLHGGNAAVPGFAIPGVAPAGASTAGGLGGMHVPPVPDFSIPGSGAGVVNDFDVAAAAIPEGGEWPPGPGEHGRPRTPGSTPSHREDSCTRTATPTPASNPTVAANAATAAAVMSGTAPGAVTGYFSPLSKVYMNDVIDHLEMVVGSSEQFVSTCDHLTDYVFNVLSFQTNNSMERLSIVTVIFLPLTFISSYFGMNFTDFDALENNVWYFWKLALPLTIAFFVIFSFTYIQTGWDTLKRRVQRRQRERDIGRSRAYSGEKL